ncbi:LamG domain-containing protein [Leptothoe spongobia]|uniref:Uncharacterized protein n=1 Tax=Leptothoe spongobia TAU-MAC 1115 TaxID=1967444 RepID=A0A947DGE6_9CYAN|nr:LamG domain-containing protein [Leptothoe spongobia]MBT9316583.1 hypothetical protein [Leptothoe spongobia TAU-MAC 1115]
MASITDIWIQQTTAKRQAIDGSQLVLDIVTEAGEAPSQVVFSATPEGTEIYRAHVTGTKIPSDSIKTIILKLLTTEPDKIPASFCWLPQAVWVSALDDEGNYRVLSGDPDWPQAKAFTPTKGRSYALTVVLAGAPLHEMTLPFVGVSKARSGPGNSALALAVQKSRTIEFTLQEPITEPKMLMLIGLGVCTLSVMTPTSADATPVPLGGQTSSSPVPGIHIAVTHGKEGVMIYANGQVATMPEANSTVVGMWVSHQALSAFYRGVIQEVRVWNRARSSVEIQKNLNRRFTKIEGDLIGLWVYGRDMLKVSGDTDGTQGPKKPPAPAQHVLPMTAVNSLEDSEESSPHYIVC